MKCLTLSLFLPLLLTFAFVGSGPEGEERLTRQSAGCNSCRLHLCFAEKFRQESTESKEAPGTEIGAPRLLPARPRRGQSLLQSFWR